MGKAADVCECRKDGVHISMKLFDPEWTDGADSSGDSNSGSQAGSEEGGSEDAGNDAGKGEDCRLSAMCGGLKVESHARSNGMAWHGMQWSNGMALSIHP